jgi:hypothetical protein
MKRKIEIGLLMAENKTLFDQVVQLNLEKESITPQQNHHCDEYEELDDLFVLI